MADSHTKSHRLISLEIIGGFLDGQTFDLANGLNCVIGARGTGKTTVLEFIRYAMDAIPADADSRKSLDALVKGNLDTGRIHLKVKTKDGASYIVSRSAGEDPILLNEDGSKTELSLRSGVLFEVDAYSQNDVENIADLTDSQLKLIDRFEADRMKSIEQQTNTLIANLRANAGVITPLVQRREMLKEELGQKEVVEENLKQLGEAVGEDAVAINEAHILKSKRHREARAMTNAQELLREADAQLQAMKGMIVSRSNSIISYDLIDGPNTGPLSTVLSGLRECSTNVDSRIQEALEYIRDEQEQVLSWSTKLNAAHDEQEFAFRTLIEKDNESREKASRRTQLEKERNTLLDTEQECEQLQIELESVREQRKELLQQLSELRDERFQIRHEIVERINQSLSPFIRVSLIQYGNLDQYQELLEEALKDAGIQRKQVARKIVDTLSPTDLSDYVRQQDPQPLVDTSELNPDQAQKVANTLFNSSILFELEIVELHDSPKIELNDNGTFKETSTLSKGQKCNTVLPILLLEGDNPLLIDQPEDNLDNSFICDTVIEAIEEVKKRRQLIFVTHNPNIPVLGEADKVYVMKSNGIKAHIEQEGTVDECRQHIVKILEGGAAAFLRRSKTYTLKEDGSSE